MTELPQWAVIEALLRAPDRGDLPQIRTLTHQAIAANREDDDIGCGDELYGLCFLLYLVGDAEDVVLLHEAKRLNMDTGSMIDGDLFTMRRDRETMLRAIEALPSGIRHAVAAAFDQPSYESPAALEAALRSYFRLD
jgi:hypothetical protein